MGSKYSKEELAALDEKFEHPEKSVSCPRCGHELVFKGDRSGCEVRCETDGCLYDCIRGL